MLALKDFVVFKNETGNMYQSESIIFSANPSD